MYVWDTYNDERVAYATRMRTRLIDRVNVLCCALCRLARSRVLRDVKAKKNSHIAHRSKTDEKEKKGHRDIFTTLL